MRSNILKKEATICVLTRDILIKLLYTPVWSINNNNNVVIVVIVVAVVIVANILEKVVVV